jgi:hypothetical protein
MGLLMELLMDVLSDGDAHVIARGGWMFELFLKAFCGRLTLLRVQISHRVIDAWTSVSATRSEMV